MNKEKIKSKGIIERDRAIEYLRELLHNVEKGNVAVEAQDQCLSLSLPEFVKLEVEAERKNGKGDLSFEISWKEGLGAAEDLGLRFCAGENPTVHEPVHSKPVQSKFRQAVSMQPEFMRTESPAQEPSPISEM